MSIYCNNVRRTALLIVLSLLTLGIESCLSHYSGRWTVIDTGGALAQVGQLRPRLRVKEAGDVHHQVMKKGNQYIVRVPIAFVPPHYPLITHRTGHDNWQDSKRNTLKCGGFDYYSEAEIMRAPEEFYYVTLNEKQYAALTRNRKGDCFFPPPAELKGIALTPHADIGDAAPINTPAGDKHLPKLWKLDIDTIPPRRTWYNRLLQPLSWAAELADIPLSLLATPIGWLADAIYEPLHR